MHSLPCIVLFPAGVTSSQGRPWGENAEKAKSPDAVHESNCRLWHWLVQKVTDVGALLSVAVPVEITDR